MSEFRKALIATSKALTWTERIYLISPLLLGALKDLARGLGVAGRREKRLLQKIAVGVEHRNRATLAYFDQAGQPIVVQRGPFAGLNCARESAGSLLGAKVMGTYESEISSWFETYIMEKSHDVFVDVGCAEGYYAVGMAKRLPDLKVYAFDIDKSAQRMASELSQLNGVADRVAVTGVCDHRQLQHLLSVAKRPLLLMDIEGGEDELLDPIMIPALLRADVIVEIHEYRAPGLTYRILQRFTHTHRIDAVAAEPDTWKAQNVASGRDSSILAEVVAEGRRLPQLWLRLCAK